MPDTSNKILRMLSINYPEITLNLIESDDVSDNKVNEIKPLFPRVE